MSIVVGDIDVVGDEDEGFTVLGASGRGGSLARHAPVRIPTPSWMRAATSQGVSRPQEDMDPLPFEPAIIGDGESPPAANTTGVLIANPQRPFRGERIVMSAIGDDGSDLSRLIVIDPAIFCGTTQIGAAQGATPVSAYAATAFGVRLSFPAAGQGTTVKIFVRLLAAPTGGVNQIVVTATVFGRAMR